MSGVTAASAAAYAAAAAVVVGAGVSAYSTIENGKQQKKMAEDQAQIAVNDAEYKKDAARAQAEKIRKMGELQKSEARASLAASGVKIGEGTPLEITKNITTLAEEDALSALLGGKRAADSANTEAQMLMRAGKNAQTNSRYAAGATVLSAAGTVAGGWSKPKATTTTTP